MAKQLIKLTEEDLRNIVKESIKRIIREMNEYPAWGVRSQTAMGNDPKVVQRKLDSLRKYWASKGLSGEELERKVQTILHNQSGIGTMY